MVERWGMATAFGLSIRLKHSQLFGTLTMLTAGLSEEKGEHRFCVISSPLREGRENPPQC